MIGDTLKCICSFISYKGARGIVSDYRFKMKEKGFTLVELMVVVGIIGILVVIAVPVYNNMNAKANRGAVEANLRNIDGAIIRYKSANEGGVPVQADLTSYFQVWPSGPDGVEYLIDGGRGQAKKGTNTGPWFGTGPYKLPITWP